jgi:hypothetical protein
VHARRETNRALDEDGSDAPKTPVTSRRHRVVVEIGQRRVPKPDSQERHAPDGVGLRALDRDEGLQERRLDDALGRSCRRKVVQSLGRLVVEELVVRVKLECVRDRE